jgi:hypothetical protein
MALASLLSAQRERAACVLIPPISFQTAGASACLCFSLTLSLAAAPFYLKKEGDKSFLKFICSQCSAVKKNKLVRAGNKSIERGWIRAEAKNM